MLYAFVRGGAPERLGGAQLLCAAVLTDIAHQNALPDYAATETSVLAVDIALLVRLVVLPLYADRVWPLWIVVLHAPGTTAHVAEAIDPTILRLGYAILAEIGANPITAILIVATIRHRWRTLPIGSDRDWRFQAAACAEDRWPSTGSRTRSTSASRR